jgi:hypothetical protein
MSNNLVTLNTVKDFLDVIHTGDDAKLQRLLDSAVQQAANYIGYSTPDAYQDFLESSENPYEPTSENPLALPESFVTGVCLLTQANYQSGSDQFTEWTDAARTVLFTLRVDLGL